MLCEDSSFILYDKPVAASPVGGFTLSPNSMQNNSSQGSNNLISSPTTTTSQQAATNLPKETQATVSSLAIQALFKKSKLMRSLVPYLHIVASLVWILGKACYVCTLFSLYNAIHPKEFEMVSIAGEQHTAVWLFYFLFGACLAAMGTEWMLHQLASKVAQQHDLPSFNKQHSILRFIQQQLAVWLPNLIPNKDKDSTTVVMEKVALSTQVLTKMLIHTVWILFPLLLWIAAFKILNPMRVIMLEYSEYLLLLVLGGSLGWLKKHKNVSVSTPNIIFLIVAIFFYCLANDYLILGHVFKFRDVFIPNVTFQDFVLNIWGVVICLGSILLGLLRKNHARRIAPDVFGTSSSTDAATHRLYWFGMSFSCLFMIPLILVSFLFNPKAILLELTSVTNSTFMICMGIGSVTVPYFADRMAKELMDLYHSSPANLSSTPLVSTPVYFADKMAPPLSWRLVITFLFTAFVFGQGCHFVSIIATPFLVLAVVDLPTALGAGASYSSASIMDSSILPLSLNMGNQGSFTNGMSQTKKSIGSFTEGITTYLRFILSNKDSRYLFFFLCANLTFMLVELIYGILSNSLGLISDSAHMLFDCGALVIGLYGAFMSKWKPDHTYTYGFYRFEVLSGFVNGLLLVFIAVYIFFEAFHRLFDPPVVEGDRLLLISVMGFAINMTGVIFFHHDAHGEHANDNMYGVYLHMLADTMGSVGVITSTILIQYFGWHLADPVCSIIISGLILTASYPLLKHSSMVLLQRSPAQYDEGISCCVQEIEKMDGVIQVLQPHFWAMSSSHIIGSLHVRVREEMNEQEMLKRMNEVFRSHVPFQQLAIQILK